MPPVDTESVTGLDDAVFDFVVVGGGTSGLVVANRLTELPGVRVLVLEAGANRLGDPRIVVPGLAPATFEDPDFDWDFRSIPQGQLNDRQLVGSKGRTLGGSSAINLGMVIYPSEAGMNAWEQLGNPGWGWSEFAPYTFFEGMHYEQEDQGSDGPVQVSFGDQYMPYHAAWMDAFRALGYPPSADPIKGKGTGPFVTPGAVDSATLTRSHAGAAYFSETVQQRQHLRVVTGALVDKLILETRNGSAVATALQFSKGGKNYTISVNKEVVLAAGATQTPQILELSGIGDANLLRSHGIDPVIDNPSVGENLQDHGIVSFSYEVADGIPSGDMARDPAVAAAAMAAYQKDGSGPLGMVSMVSAFMPCLEFPDEERAKLLQQVDEKQSQVLHQLLKDPNEPTVQYVLAPFQLRPRAGPDPKAIFGLGHPGFFISIFTLLSYPLSRGSVHIQSKDPTDKPSLNHGILNHPADLELHARHCMWTEKMVETEPMAALLKKNGERLHTPERLTDLDKAKELCKELVLSMYHSSGTCAMMPQEDGGVVDARLRVYGTSNIRVVDASLFPLVPRGNIQATVYAVAEKAADIIKEDLWILLYKIQKV
ncbi:putative aryl-alcohol dehydrogenase [Aspergillus ellipticus CBS 707.79]|uniref:Putative aryl-alcohol dehydrogenase n=1 Tax=Aspergillus ellipticus CBS 707.79 TaxID=1448320 RepID=A0A319D226_9EURO|nr:putative aryl-alcohol dehydrogenase [Aspergillus ellipticus CBS 707.79]